MTHSQSETSELLQKFEYALMEFDGDCHDLSPIFRDYLRMIDRLFCWPDAIRRIAHIRQPLHPMLRKAFHEMWEHHGQYIRPAVGDDLLLTDALRKLLPAYKGGRKTLYRGETAANRARDTYGLSWTPLLNIAKGFCTGMNQLCRPKGGMVLLQADVPAPAIIAAVREGYYHEREYLVDRRGLKQDAVSVVKAYTPTSP